MTTPATERSISDCLPNLESTVASWWLYRVNLASVSIRHRSMITATPYAEPQQSVVSPVTSACTMQMLHHLVDQLCVHTIPWPMHPWVSFGLLNYLALHRSLGIAVRS